VILTGVIDREAEIERNRKMLAEVQGHLKRCEAKLANQQFLSKAPAEVVELQRKRQRELQEQLRAIEENLRTLGAA